MTQFKQIIGRGTRIREAEGKLSFVVMDFRGVTRLFADPEWDDLSNNKIILNMVVQIKNQEVAQEFPKNCLSSIKTSVRSKSKTEESAIMIPMENCSEPKLS